MSAATIQISKAFRRRITRATCRALGVCIVCQRLEARPGRTTCQGCADAHTDFIRRQRAARLDAGLCTRCGHVKAASGKQMCDCCADKQNRWDRECRRKLSV